LIGSRVQAIATCLAAELVNHRMYTGGMDTNTETPISSQLLTMAPVSLSSSLESPSDTSSAHSQIDVGVPVWTTAVVSVRAVVGDTVGL